MTITETQKTTINHVGILSPMDANGEKDVWDAFKHGLAPTVFPLFQGACFETAGMVLGISIMLNFLS